MSKKSPWLIIEKPNRTATRLYCFAYAGGSASVFAGWQEVLGDRFEVCAVQLPGRGMRFAEAPLQSMSQLVQEVVRVIIEDATQPFAFFGHSLGALVAFEVSRYLRSHYMPQPRHVFVSGAAAPQRRDHSRKLYLLPDAELIEELKEYNGTPPEILNDQTLMTLLLPMIRADFKLAEDYVYRASPKLNLPLTVFTGDQDEYVSTQQAEAWQLETSGPCDVQVLNGDHFFLNERRDDILAIIGHRMALDVLVAA